MSLTKDRAQLEPTHAQVIAQELEQYGVQKDRIILQERSFNTITELKELVKIIAQHQWKHTAVITNDYHIPRVQEMLNQLLALSSPTDADYREVVDALQYTQNNAEIVFVSAEDVLPIRSPHYRQLIDNVRKSEAYRQRLKAEEQGLKDLREGKYRT